MPAPIQATASAPGKLILFGEHAVVYGHTAVAAALSGMRISVHVALLPTAGCAGAQSPGSTDVLEATLHDLPSGSRVAAGPVHVCIPLAVLARSAAALGATVDDDSWQLVRSADPAAIHELGALLGDAPESDKAALVPLLFLTVVLLPQLVSAGPSRVHGRLEIHVRSAGLPVGAGLGSSAAFSVALAAALLRLQLQLSARDGPPTGRAARVAALATGSPASPVALLEGASTVESVTPNPPAKELINGWAYRAECILHGTPSGLDNAVSCAGGGMQLTSPRGSAPAAGQSRSGSGLAFAPIAHLPELLILVTNTRVPRSTRDLVARVRALHESHPAITEHLFSAIAGVAQTFLHLASHTANSCNGIGGDGVTTAEGRSDGASVGGKAKATDGDLASELLMLIRANHGLLCALGVSGVALEDVVATTAREGISTKLTGAGGGGCALSLVGVGEVSAGAAAAAARAKRRLESKGYACYLTRVGGAGVLWHNTPQGEAPLADRGLRAWRARIGGAGRFLQPLPLLALAGTAAGLCAVARAARR
jgi:mevalonate kinase